MDLPTKNFASPFFSAFAMTKALRKSECRSLTHEKIKKVPTHKKKCGY